MIINHYGIICLGPGARVKVDNTNTAGTVEIQACGVSSIGVVESTDSATRYDTVKQEAQLSKRNLAVG